MSANGYHTPGWEWGAAGTPPESGGSAFTPQSLGGDEADTAVRAPILVAGVGNVLLTDDGVGVHAAWELQKNPIAGVAVVDIGTAVLHGLRFLEEADRVLMIDAAKGGQAPGTLYLFEGGEDAGRPSLLSVHAMGLREAMSWLPAGSRRPAVTVLGIEPASLDYGLELSPAVRAALPRVVALAHEIVVAWKLAPTASRSGRPHASAARTEFQVTPMTQSL